MARSRFTSLSVGRWMSVGAALLCCTDALAASAWATHGELGLVMVRGDTNTNSGDVKLDVARRLGRWTYSAGAAALYASTNGLSTEQDTNAHLRVDMRLGHRTFWFSDARYDRNLFSGFAYQESAASGIGRVLVHTKKSKFSAEIGAGLRRQRPEQLALNGVGAVISRKRLAAVDDPVVHAGAQFRHRLTHDSTLLNTLLVESGASDTLSADNLSLQVQMHKTLALSVAVQVTDNTNLPPGKVSHTNTVMTVNLVYNFHTAKISALSPVPTLLQGLNLP